MPIQDQLEDRIHRLASFEPTGMPVISLYLNTQADQHGRDNFGTFLRRALKERLRTYPSGSPARTSLERDAERILRYLNRDLAASTNGLALFASSGSSDFFEAIQLAAPVDEHWLYVADQPQLYPLARVDSRYPRYAAVVADTSFARIMVFSTGRLVDTKTVQGVKTRGHGGIGGWSQSRYQRHVENDHLHLVKELVEVLDRVIRQEKIATIILAGDEAVLPLLKDQLPKHLQERTIEELHLPAKAPDHEVLAATLEALERYNVRSDADKVDQVLAAARAGGLGVVGAAGTLAAFDLGRVEELLISASLRDIRPLGDSSEEMRGVQATIERGGADVTEERSAHLADGLVTRARQTGARITVIEDGALLSEFGGVAALLRF